MLKEVVFMSICFVLFSGCAITETSDTDVETQNKASDLQTPPTINETADRAQSEPADQAALQQTAKSFQSITAVGSAYVKLVQEQLRGSGFYSGAIDGIAGAKTRSAIRRFKSGCAALRDLIPDAQAGTAKQTANSADGARPEPASADGIRVVQLRLKDAGFNPGPIDGIRGAKTESALSALQSGCVMLQNFSSADMQSPVGTASEGSTETPPGKTGRQAIMRLQRRLRDAGFDPGPIDGILGPQTKSAMQTYKLASHRNL